MSETAQSNLNENSSANSAASGHAGRTVGKYTIEAGIPLPADTKHKRSKYPFAEMCAGESVVIPGVKLATLRCALTSWRKRHGIDLEMRSHGDAFRVWRKA